MIELRVFQIKNVSHLQRGKKQIMGLKLGKLENKYLAMCNYSLKSYKVHQVQCSSSSSITPPWAADSCASAISISHCQLLLPMCHAARPASSHSLIV